jgi:hypothetical protein
MIIKKAVITDAEAILNIQKLAYQSEAEISHDSLIAPLTQTLAEIEKDFSLQTVLKAVDSDIIVGSVRAYEQSERNVCFYQKRGYRIFHREKIHEHLIMVVMGKQIP